MFAMNDYITNEELEDQREQQAGELMLMESLSGEDNYIVQIYDDTREEVFSNPRPRLHDVGDDKASRGLGGRGSKRLGSLSSSPSMTMVNTAISKVQNGASWACHSDERGRSSESDGNRCKCWKWSWAVIMGVAALATLFQLGRWSVDVEDRHSGIAVGNTDEEKKMASSEEAVKKMRSHLSEARNGSRELLEMLEKYYFGRDAAIKMLMQSWDEDWDFSLSSPPFHRRTSASHSNNYLINDSTNNLMQNYNLIKDSNLNDKNSNSPNDEAVKGIIGDESNERSLLVNPKKAEHQKQRVDKLIDTMARSLTEALLYQWIDSSNESPNNAFDESSSNSFNKSMKPFIIGVLGSNIAAGHENCHYDNYVSQMCRTLAPMFQTAKLELQCENAGIGHQCGDSQDNVVYCLKNYLSPEVDIVHYVFPLADDEFEQAGNGLQAEGEMIDRLDGSPSSSPNHYDGPNDNHSDGYDNYSDGYDDSSNGNYVARENLIRWTQMLPRQPPVHAVNILPRPENHDAEGNPTAGNGNGGISPSQRLTRYYSRYGHNAFYLQTAYENGGSEKSLGEFSEELSGESLGELLGGSLKKIGDGVHNTTRYGEELRVDSGGSSPLQEELLKKRRESLGAVMRNEHVPGPLGFQLIADAFAYLYATAMLYAVDEVSMKLDALLQAGQDPLSVWLQDNPAANPDETDNSDKSDSANAWPGRTPASKESLPAGLYCPEIYCSVSSPPRCASFAEPSYGYAGVHHELPSSANSLKNSPYQDELQNWTLWDEDLGSNYMVGLQDAILLKSLEGIQDNAFHFITPDQCQHQDKCGGIKASKANHGTVVFRLPQMEVGLVLLCGQGPKFGSRLLRYFKPYIQITFNDQIISLDHLDVFPNDKCIRIQKQFDDNNQNMAHSHPYLTVTIAKDLNMAEEVSITQVISL